MSELQEARQAIDLMFKTYDLVLNTPVSISQLFINISQGTLKNDTILKALGKDLEKEISAGRVDIVEINPEHFAQERGDTDVNAEDRKKAAEAMNDISKQLNTEGIFARAYMFEGKYYVLTLASQRELVQSFIDKELSSSVYNMYSTREIAAKSKHEVGTFTIEGTESNEKTLAIVKRAKLNNIPVNIAETENGKYTIRYPKSDELKMSRIKRDVCIDFTGDAKEIIKRQLQWEDKNTTKLINKAINQEVEPGKCIVDKNGNYIEFEKNNIELRFNDNTKKIIKYNEKRYMDNVLSFTGSMNGMIEVDKKIAERYRYSANQIINLNKKKPEMHETDTEKEIQEKKVKINEIEKKQLAIDKDMKTMFMNGEKEAGRPELSEDEIKIIKNTEKNRELLNSKLMQNHPEEREVTIDDYNSEQPYIVFKEYEEQNEESIEETNKENNKEEKEEVEDRMLQADSMYKKMEDYEPDLNIDDEIAIEEQFEEIENEYEEDIELDADLSMSEEEI